MSDTEESVDIISDVAVGNTEITQLSFIDHCRKRDMWSGSRKITEVEDMLFINGKWKKRKFLFVPAFLKTIDEMISNMIDVYIKSTAAVKKTFTFSVIYDSAIGAIKFVNTGAFPIKRLKSGDWTVQACFLDPRTSSNFSSEGKHVTGGLNGIGLKTVVAFSKLVKVATWGATHCYKQSFTGQKSDGILTEPDITERKKAKNGTKLKQQTSITYIPDYEFLKLKDVEEANGEALEVTITNIIMSRIKFASIYINKPFKFNNKIISDNFKTLIDQITPEGCTFYKTKVDLIEKSKIDKPWEVAFCVTNKDGFSISLGNGIYALDGTHIKSFHKQILEHVRSKASRVAAMKNTTITPKSVSNKIIIIFRGQLRDVDYSSQTKSFANLPREILSLYKPLNDSVKNKVWNDIREYLMPTLDSSVIRNANNAIKKMNLNDIKKYTKASMSKTRPMECTLLLPEGDSAGGAILPAINNLPDDERSRFGILTLGAIMNPKKQKSKAKAKKKVNSEREAVSSIFKDKFEKSKKIREFMAVVGLKIGCTYDKISDIETLNYGRLVICTDQDIDGTGNICPLDLNLIHTLWPGLIRNGRVGRLFTPLCLATPKAGRNKNIEKFYLEKHLDDWVSENDASLYNLEYLKGLGQDENQIIETFENFEENVQWFKYDKDTDKTFADYFGEDTVIRKRILREPLHIPSREDYVIGSTVGCTEFLELERKNYDLNCKLFRASIHAADGLSGVRRKILFASRKYLSGKMKVVSFTGRIMADCGYHHGDASLNGAITAATSCYPGSTIIPLLLSNSNIYGRIYGSDYSAAASARYMVVSYNKAMNLLFPPEDDYLLEKLISDGKRYEPHYYIPVVPYSLMQNYAGMLVGWSQCVVARDYDTLVAAIKAKLHDKPTPKLTPSHAMFTGTIDEVQVNPSATALRDSVNGTAPKSVKTTFTGKYEVTDYGFHITELPMLVPSNKYKDDLLAKKGDIIDDIDDGTEKFGNVNMKIMIKDQQHANWDQKEILQFLKISKSITSQLNIPTGRHDFTEFKSYKAVFNYWFEERKKLYLRRFSRQRAVIRLKIMMMENMIRYVNEFTELDIVKKATHIVNKKLEDNKFLKMYVVPITTNNDILEKDLEPLVLGDKASYNYLDLKDSAKFKESNIKRREDLKKLKELLKRLNQDEDTLLKETWISDIDKLTEAINVGLPDRWGHRNDKSKSRKNRKGNKATTRPKAASRRKVKG